MSVKSEYKRLEGVGEASLFRGDPRLPSGDLDSWFLTALTAVEEAKARPHLYGADAGFCARRNVLLANNYSLPTTVTSANNAYMRIGVALEDMLAEALRRTGRLLRQNTYLIDMPEVKVRGKIDLLFIDPKQRVAITEVKTCGELPTEPKPTHLAQVQTYSAISGIRVAYLTYISRHVQASGSSWSPHLSMRSFEVDTSDAALSNRLRIALLSQEASRLKATPPVPSTFRKHTECHVCEFRDLHCWKPRPGSRAEGISPTAMHELTPEEYIRLDQAATTTANSMMAAIVLRKLETLFELLTDDYLALDEVNREVLAKELKDTKGIIERGL